MKKRFRLKWGQVLPWLSIVPLLVAFWGYWLGYANESGAPVGPGQHAALFFKSLYSSVQIYGLSINNELMKLGKPGYVQLEVARWLALIVTTSVFANLIRSAARRLGAFLRAARPDAVAVHGDESRALLLRRQLGARSVPGDTPERFRAPTHILAFESARAMYQYINQNHEAFFRHAGKRLYLCTLEALHPVRQDGGIVVSNVAENCARRYWEDAFLRRGEKRVAFIGFGEYGRALLTQALLVNVYEEPRQIRYTVYGDPDDYPSLHPALGELVSLNGEAPGRDALFFRAGPWKRHIDELRGADRIIVCENADEENMAILDQLLEYGVGGRIHVRAVSQVILQRLWNCGGDCDRIGVFGTDDQLYTPDIIMRGSLMRRAMLIHARYIRHSKLGREVCEARKCDKPATACLDCEVCKEDWAALDAFKRNSNVAQADHMSVKIREVLGTDAPIDADALRAYKRAYEMKPPAEKKKLMELEHDRWMRFHIFHGWRYDPVRDDRAKRHNLLVPYDQLPDGQWIKDEDAFTMIPEILESEDIKAKGPGGTPSKRRQISMT